jgi:predicted CoA-binding protein
MIISDDPEAMRRVLLGSRTIAVVGCSPKPHRDSYQVAAYLKRKGYRVIPVNPAAPEILNEKCYPDLGSIPEKVDIVDVFRAPEHVPPIAEEAMAIRADALWLQMGVVNEEAARRASDAGLYVVQDRCIRTVHGMLLRS